MVFDIKKHIIHFIYYTFKSPTSRSTSCTCNAGNKVQFSKDFIANFFEIHHFIFIIDMKSKPSSVSKSFATLSRGYIMFSQSV